MLISIIIPTLNRPEKLIYLLDRLISIVKKEELIVVDDSKVSQAEEIINRYSKKIIYIHRGDKLGVSSARNLGSRISKGEYLIFLDDDDDVADSWLEDFSSRLEKNPDLVFCNMKLVTQNIKVLSISASKENWKTVIPGAWMIKREIFDKVGGYDDRLKYAENTELFFRFDRLSLKREFVEKENLIYHQSPDGGSKNLQNMLDSIRLILEKHNEYLSDHVKHLYHQNVGVIELRFARFEQARMHLWKSWRFKPFKTSTWLRISLAYLPFLAKKIYKLDIRS
ncbi:GT2 family glycosyltransferase [Algoriphagus aquaeductus]|uniref:GT2 family glycosyltransferase n=1 Tax=Algoriphagus aquaeductus TaxID=475299 RepID=A0A326RRS8_9BACT|nr:glycosyltransferase family A protein [Algoriphagus aquaeductus]PZV76712.1 GT2 family glycosyltransferase [Algoriphagus aquaeductus]